VGKKRGRGRNTGEYSGLNHYCGRKIERGETVRRPGNGGGLVLGATREEEDPHGECAPVPVSRQATACLGKWRPQEKNRRSFAKGKDPVKERGGGTISGKRQS